MRTRTIISVGAALCVAASVLVPVGGVSAAQKAKVVGTDDAGDWGATVDPTIAPVGDALGQDLVEASIGMADKKTINFIIGVNSLPPTGGVPESSRYTWDLAVDGDAYQMSGAFTEYVRGICNPLHTDTCPPPQDPGSTPFFVRQGPCTVGSDCFVLDIVSAEFDPAEGTITIPVAMEVFGAKPGSKITPGATIFGGTIYAVPAAIVASTASPHDTLLVDKTYVIPGKKKKKKK